MSSLPTDMAGMLDPPPDVRGMKLLNADLFNKSLSLISLTVNEEKVGTIIKPLKKHLLCMRNLKNVRTAKDGRRMFLLNPDMYRDIAPTQEALTTAGVADKVSWSELF